ncbi:hypothetical protein [Pseudolysinimonas yzui]|uniref:Uncharacterized protein n=1 Tax=Pseudolysinimonas yzui TaxID=2708254 RepID=A0A8J3GPI0_9MICO|nr:hypothetical protein [Pseudolysinimonas yzui]GHF11079.1 hypothetical protein GCM10011600_10310 [Pseudolysinimonas yzui]
MRVDQSFIESVGLDASDRRHNEQLARDVVETIRLVAGERLARGLSPARLQQFIAALEDGDDRAIEWIRENISDAEIQVAGAAAYEDVRVQVRDSVAQHNRTARESDGKVAQ